MDVDRCCRTCFYRGDSDGEGDDKVYLCDHYAQADYDNYGDGTLEREEGVTDESIALGAEITGCRDDSDVWSDLATGDHGCPGWEPRGEEDAHHGR